MYLIEATTSEDFQTAVTLFKQYETELNVDLCFQDFAAELKQIDRQYSRPTGVLILVKNEDGDFIGCGGVRYLEEGICELKRMYLKQEGRGMGTGKKLLEKTTKIAIELGYTKMRLDTLPSMKAAINMYEKNGFYEIPSYRHNPVEGVRYYERSLH